MLNLTVNSTQQGHGRGLVKKACVDAAKNGMVKILLEVRSNNLIVRQFYESEGFWFLATEITTIVLLVRQKMHSPWNELYGPRP